MSLPQVDGVTFRPAVGHDGYAVGDDGSVWSCLYGGGSGHRAKVGAKWKKLKGVVTGYGYRVYCPAPSGRSRFGHHLVLEAFVGPCPEGLQCRHGDGNSLNNALSNLCWGTPLENAADRDRHGNTRRAARPEITKFSDDIVRAIRDKRKREGTTYTKLSAEFGVSFAHVAAICTGKCRKHVK